MAKSKLLRSKEFLAQLSSLADGYRTAIESVADNWDISPTAIGERVAQVNDPLTGFEYFVSVYFPHYVRSPHKSELHKYLFDKLPKVANDPDSRFLAIAAPRGEAKSTLVSQLYNLWKIVRGMTKYSLIVMDSLDQAYPMLEAIKAELEFNPRLKSDFPDVAGVGRVWQAGTIVTKNGIKVQVAGAGKKLRGLRHGPYRPDTATLDDIENDENVRNPEQRDKLNSWLTKTIMPLGAAGEKFDIIYIGTILHYDSVLNRTLNNAGWESARFKAIIQMPENIALWDEWECLYKSKQIDEANEFYQANKKAMDKGAIVSWQARPILALMKIRARDGHEAFDSEYQNDPTAGDDAPFTKAMNFWHELPSNLIYFGAVDPSLGKAGASRDPSAIVIAGLDRASGKVYVVVADIKKRLPDKIISDVIVYQRKYNCIKWAVEAVQFQEFFRTELVRRSAQSGVPVPAMPVKPTSDKLLRIETLQPYMANELLLLHTSQSTLIDQFRHFPKADHDDGADAVEMVYKLATSHTRQSTMQAIYIPTPSIYS